MIWYLVFSYLASRMVSLQVIGAIEEDCTLAHYPFFVSIHKMNTGAICGGTLLSSNWVLTAASCVKTKKSNIYLIYVGLETGNSTMKAKHAWVSEVKLHPNYTASSKHVNDIALLRLNRPIWQNKFVSYVILPEPKTDVSCEKGMVVMFGKNYDNKKDSVHIVHCAHQILMNKSNCDKYASFSENTFCTTTADNTTIPCNDDAGGPFLCNGMQYGIITGTLACQKAATFPTIHTDVAFFIDYIKKSLVGNGQPRINFSNYLIIIPIINKYYLL